MKKKESKMFGCPIRYGLGMFGDKWSLLIIRDMMFFGKRYYGDFLKSDEGIATNILADRLAGLEQKGIINKTRDETNQTKNIYSLTQKGIDLLPTMLAIIDWSERYDQVTTAPLELVNKLRSNPKKLEKEIRLALKENRSVIEVKKE